MNTPITLFTRQPAPGQFSIEQVFRSLLPYLPGDTSFYTLPFASRGLIPRIKSGMAARQRQGRVNHITGDIMFATLFLKGNRTVVTVHDCDFIWRSSGLKRWVLYFFWLYWPLKHARYITTISEATKKDLQKLVHLPDSKIRVIPNPLTLVSGIRPPLAKNNPKPVLLHIGTKANKNLERLIPAVAGLSVKLYIIGKLTPNQSELLQLHKIDFKNEWDISGEALISRYQQADILVFASTLEGFGLPIVEANALGCPVITSNCSSMPEVAGQAALLVNPHCEESIRNGITSLLENSQLRERLTFKGYQNVKRFEPRVIAQQYLELYRELLDESR